jgi:hypothetical protein
MACIEARSFGGHSMLRPYKENGKSEKREAEAETGAETKATARTKKAKAEAKAKAGKLRARGDHL